MTVAVAVGIAVKTEVVKRRRTPGIAGFQPAFAVAVTVDR